MGKNSADLQDIILNGVRKNRIPVTMHLTNGVPLKGIIRGFRLLRGAPGERWQAADDLQARHLHRHALAARAVLALRERRPCKSFRRGDLIAL